MAKIGNAHVIEIANRVATNNTADVISGVANNLANHQSGLNTNAHQISNISGLQTTLDSKQNIISGHTGTIDIIVSVDFVNQTFQTAQINVSNGIITKIN